MSKDSSDGGCGCLIIVVLACTIGGGFWQGAAILAGGWLLYLVFIGVSIGIVVWIVKAICGK